MMYTVTMKKTSHITLSAIAILIVFGTYFAAKTRPTPTPEQAIDPVTRPKPEIAEQESPASENEIEETTATLSLSETVPHSAPFIIQAPGAKWDNPIFQDGCEEASMLMAMGWVTGRKSVTTAEAANDITALADFEVKQFGYHQDIGLPEIISVLREYFRYDQAMLLEDVTLSDIRQELSDGNIVLAPAFGQALGNPNFTSPGPITHMLVLTSYDEKTKEFVVNDPGTRRGESYRYKEDIFFESLWAFPSGTTHPPIPSPSKRQKSVIAIHPSE